MHKLEPQHYVAPNVTLRDQLVRHDQTLTVQLASDHDAKERVLDRHILATVPERWEGLGRGFKQVVRESEEKLGGTK